MDVKGTMKRAGTAAAVAGGTVAAATANMFNELLPLQAPDMKSAALAAGTAAVTAAVYGRKAHMQDAAEKARR